ncbi:MAG: 5-formyltetrahydrofolate cyclo-ligase [Ruminococcus sp.]|nr:5-formyltetrahydrofolate cyclo-ligase [Ruminococcus sp.]
MNKQLLREQMKKLRRSLDATARAEMDRAICDKLNSLTKSYDTVLCYISSEIEVSTKEYLSGLFNDNNKTVLVPRCVKGTNIMHFYPIKSFDDLEEGYFGILEPKEGIKKAEYFGENSCCIVPALCYDERGYRVGFGKGFYDRFLKDFSGQKIGICYSDCIVSRIDNDDTDIKADIVISEKSVSYINERKITSDG